LLTLRRFSRFRSDTLTASSGPWAGKPRAHRIEDNHNPQPSNLAEDRSQAYSEPILRIMSKHSIGGLCGVGVTEGRDAGSNRQRPTGADPEAATRVFAEKGFRRATTREVARVAVVSEGTIYNYFEDKDALLVAILDGLNETERRAEDFEEGMATDFRGSSENI
jgi:hypothetical protein